MPATRRKRSEAWKYFELIDGKAICQIKECFAELTWHGSTTALNAHLQSRHHDIISVKREQRFSSQKPLSATPKQKSQSISRVVFTPTPITNQPKLLKDREQMITSKILEWITTGRKPACVVEENGFREFVRILDPTYTLPTAASVSLMINSRFFKAKENLKQVLKCAVQHCKISLSICQAHDSQECLYLMTHFITSMWEPRSFIIGTLSTMHTERTGGALAKWIADKLKQFDIFPSSVIAVVYGSDSYIENATNLLSVAYGWHAVKCCHFQISFAIQNALKNEDTTRSLRDVDEMMQDLKQGQVGSILFNSKFSTFTKKQESETPFSFSGPNSPSTKPYPNGHSKINWNFAYNLLCEMKPLEAALCYLIDNDRFLPIASTPILLAGLERWLTSDDFIPFSKLNNFRATQGAESASDLLIKFNSKLLEEICKLTEFDSKDVHTIAAALHPYYKELNFMKGDHKLSVQSSLIADCFQIHKDDVENKLKKDSQMPENSQRLVSSNSLVDDLMKLGSGCVVEKESDPITDHDVLMQKVRAETSAYFAEKTLSGDNSPFSWWQTNGMKYPLLSRLARNYLSIPATATYLPKTWDSRDVASSLPCNAHYCNVDNISIVSNDTL